MREMKTLKRLICLAIMCCGTSFAQSNLPPCPTTGIKTNCFGTQIFANGQKYVGEFKDGKYDGQGTMYFTNSTVTYSGFWANDRFLGKLPELQSDSFVNNELGRLRASAIESQKKNR